MKMAIALKGLSKYSRIDKEKRQMIDELLRPRQYFQSKPVYKKISDIRKIQDDPRQADELQSDFVDAEFETCDIAPYEDDLDEEVPVDKNRYEDIHVFQSKRRSIEFTKYCPECGRKYQENKDVCLDCLVHLRKISDKADVRDIDYDPQITVVGSNDFKSFDELLSPANMDKLASFEFSDRELSEILTNIKAQAFRNFDEIASDNGIHFDSLPILDKIMLFAKSFVAVDFKSYGGELGYFEKNTIYLDDRQTDALQITTLLHELSHFLVKEILIHVLCKILDASKNEFIDRLVEFILNNSAFAELVDEYAAHNVEGRFTLFGYQDYSSFKRIENSLKGEMDSEEIEITKSIGNNFSIKIKEILESFIDRDLRDEIKVQFKKDILERPDYRALMNENCKILTRNSFISAIVLILTDGCMMASRNIESLSI